MNLIQLAVELENTIESVDDIEDKLYRNVHGSGEVKYDNFLVDMGYAIHRLNNVMRMLNETVGIKKGGVIDN